MICPKCSSENIHRSRHRSRWESLRKSLSNKRLYRCHDCSWRGWLTSSEPEKKNVSPQYRIITYVAVVAIALLAFWLLIPHLQ